MENTTEKLLLNLPLSHFTIIQSADHSMTEVFFNDVKKHYSLVPLHNYFLHEEDSFTRSHAEELLGHVRQTPKDATDRFFVLGINKITPEASNMLLKSFEETSEHNHFVIIIPKKEYLPETLCSRAVTYSFLSETSVGQVQTFFNTFINTSKINRLQLIENFLLQYETEDMKRKLIGDVRIFFDTLELWLSQQSTITKTAVGPFLYKAKTYLLHDNASVKMILETCALVITKDYVILEGSER